MAKLFDKWAKELANQFVAQMRLEFVEEIILADQFAVFIANLVYEVVLDAEVELIRHGFALLHQRFNVVDPDVCSCLQFKHIKGVVVRMGQDRVYAPHNEREEHYSHEFC